MDQNPDAPAAEPLVFPPPWPFARDDLMQRVHPGRRRRVGRPMAWFVLWPVLILATGPVAGLATGLLYGLFASGVFEQHEHSFFHVLHPAIALAYAALFLVFLKWAAARGLASATVDPRPTRLATESLQAVILLVATIVTGGMLLTALSELLPLPAPPPNPVPVEAGAMLFWIALPGLVLIGPAVEEMIFRGWMLPALRARGLSWGLAIAISSLAFGMLHGLAGPLALVYTTLVGVSAGLLRMQTGRLWAPILLHALNNLVVIGLPQIAARMAG